MVKGSMFQMPKITSAGMEYCALVSQPMGSTPNQESM